MVLLHRMQSHSHQCIIRFSYKSNLDVIGVEGSVSKHWLLEFTQEANEPHDWILLVGVEVG